MAEKIFVVEDDQASQGYMYHAVRRLGYEVAVAKDGREALEKIGQEQPDLVLLDIMLPEVSGLEVARELKKDPRTRHIPIIATTALAFPEDREKCLQAGCDGYMAKPVTPQALSLQIEKCLLRQKILSSLCRIPG